MKLIITRHGQTEENKAGILQGHLPGKLSTLGIEQAKKLALRLKDEKIDYIYSSDLARAESTAKEITQYHPNISIEFTQELRERDLGEYTGIKKSEIGYHARDLITDALQPKDGESEIEFHNRAEQFFNRILKKHPNDNDTVLFVGHHGINKNIVSVITNTPVNELKGQKNTSINIFEIDQDKNYKLLIDNCAKHLD